MLKVYKNTKSDFKDNKGEISLLLWEDNIRLRILRIFTPNFLFCSVSSDSVNKL